ncbi:MULTISPECIES: squalene synthase HpnC [unclassified Pigmentiphaga]|uniref:squalene synthase HpnC n=1 Tax=unclassified Pigmentiphaga TaxID=2626614 RepID=UPI000B40F2BD|nr:MULTISPECIES: squalene synthase HpnC [unclassified Pigmentiphaga]OVZ66087.1 squalene synthase HpnC [Pigmentiphaga sp. NML030171]
MSAGHYENFPVASLLLPPRLRTAVLDIYRYARAADDIADEGDASDRERLAALARFGAGLDWIGEGARAQPPAPELAAIFVPLASTVARHRLPLVPFRRLLSAFAQDVTVKRYEDFAALRDYCHRSADPVGELMLHLYEAATPRNLAWSDAICTGLQLTNFWQDVAVDWGKHRVYIPREDLARHGVAEADIAAGRCSPAWRALMAFEVDRARALLHSGAPLARALPGRIGWELRLVVQGGLRILERIEAGGYDVFRARPVLKKTEWLKLAWRALRMPQATPAPPPHHDA